MVAKARSLAGARVPRAVRHERVVDLRASFDMGNRVQAVALA